MESYLQTKGRIFDIQRYSIHDGPGIRTIVFLKGCFLRCRWCSNPESQNYEIETMLSEEKEKIIGRDVTVAEAMETVKKDAGYYRRSKGGLTLSGGECLYQSEFARDLLHAARREGYHTAIESTGYAPFEQIGKLLPYLDLFLLDIKHINTQKHKEYTGVPNELILKNARKIAEYQGVEVIIRVPVIPTFNESPKEIKEIATFADKLPGVQKIHLLPYHRLGEDKYHGLGREYLMKDILPPTVEYMEMLKEIVEQNSRLHCQIGG